MGATGLPCFGGGTTGPRNASLLVVRITRYTYTFAESCDARRSQHAELRAEAEDVRRRRAGLRGRRGDRRRGGCGGNGRRVVQRRSFRAHEDARMPRTSASRFASRAKSDSFDEGGNGVGVESDVGGAPSVMGAAPTGVVGVKTALCVGTRPHGVERRPARTFAFSSSRGYRSQPSSPKAAPRCQAPMSAGSPSSSSGGRGGGVPCVDHTVRLYPQMSRRPSFHAIRRSSDRASAQGRRSRAPQGARALGRVERQGRRGGQSCVIAHRALACNPHITCKHTPAHTGNY